MAELGNMVCTVLIPAKAGSVSQVGHSVHLDINTGLCGVPLEVEAKVRDLLAFSV